jgi:sortase A
MKYVITLILAGFLAGGVGASLIQPTPAPASALEAPIRMFEAYEQPRRLVIPVLGIAALVEPVGLDFEGRMAVPEDWTKAGWFAPGTVPGKRGSAVIAGHYDSPTGPALFADLDALQAGDEIIVIDGLGRSQQFEVLGKRTFSDKAFPVEQIFGASELKLLNLITCEGVFDRRSENYSHRVVVFSRLVE